MAAGIGCCLHQPAEAAFPEGIVAQRFMQRGHVELRPGLRRHPDFRVADLPKQEVADAHFACGADEQVRIGHAGRVERSRERGLVDRRGLKLPLRDQLRQRSRRVHQLGAGTVVDGQAQGQPAIPAAELHVSVDLAEHVGRQSFAATDDAEANVLFENLFPLFNEILLQQGHQEIQLCLRPLPVLGAEAVKAELFEPQPARLFHHRPDRAHAAGVPLRSGLAALAGPPAVAIHDDRHVPGQPMAQEPQFGEAFIGVGLLFCHAIAIVAEEAPCLLHFLEAAMRLLQSIDPPLFAAISQEERRQQEGLEMIASENYTSTAVMAAQGSVLTNKYAEGYPGRRYYGGCQHVDVVEQLALDRARQLFGAEHANVQPHSGAQANMAVYLASLEPGDTLLSLDLAHGGHLTHGMKLNFSGRYFRIVHYGVEPGTERIDMGKVAKLAREHRPKMIVAGASAYPRHFDFAAFGTIAREVGALFMVDMAHIAGLVAAKVHPDPVPHADFVTTTTHKTLRGPRGGMVLCRAAWEKKINSAVFPGVQGGPLMHVIAAKAVAYGEALRPEFKAYAEQTIANAQTLAAALQSAGYRIISGGTDNHLLLVDVTSKGGMTGKIAEKALDHAGITVNKNLIPFDQRPPLDPSGIRLGTPALTTRGMKEEEMKQVASWIDQALSRPEDTAALGRIAGAVRELAAAFPAPMAPDA